MDPLFAASADVPYSAAYRDFRARRPLDLAHASGRPAPDRHGRRGPDQRLGGPVVEIKAGDAAWCPPGVKHWHGATLGSAMTYLALTGQKDGRNVQWLEKVSDEQYGR